MFISLGQLLLPISQYLMNFIIVYTRELALLMKAGSLQYSMQTYVTSFIYLFLHTPDEIIFSTYLGGDAPGTHSPPVIELYYSIASSPATTLYFGGSTTVSNISLVDPIRNYNSSLGVNNLYLAVINITGT